MSILWCGGEDVDFQNGTGTFGVDTTAGRFRAEYARCGLTAQNRSGVAWSSTFSGGAVTSCWLSFRGYPSALSSTTFLIGLGNSSSGGATRGLWLSVVPGVVTRLRLLKYDGSSETVLATEAGNSFPNASTTRIVMQITSFSDTVNGNCKVYINDNPTPIIDYTGNMTTTGVTSLDIIMGSLGWNETRVWSEFIVADEDIRSFALLTCYPNAAGDVNNWVGSYSYVDETVISDADLVYSTGNDNDMLMNVTDSAIAVAGTTYGVRAVRLSARSYVDVSSPVTGLQLGVKLSGSFDYGATQVGTSSWYTYERIMNTNPVSSAPWLSSEITNLQLNLRSKT